MRGKQAKRHELKPDQIYGSPVVSRLINKVMLDGKKTTAEKIVYTSLDNLAKETGKKQIEALDIALNNVRPEVEVRSRRVGGANYQVPLPTPEYRQLALAVRWIVDAARAAKGANMEVKLTKELLNAYNKTGSAMKKKDDVIRMAEANKAFSHFAVQ